MGMSWNERLPASRTAGCSAAPKVAFPKADVPIVQVSLLASMDAAEHIRLGQARAPLRDEGVLIVGSGMSYHNMPTFMSRMRGSNALASRRRVTTV